MASSWFPLRFFFGGRGGLRADRKLRRSTEDVERRLDRVIGEINDVQRPYMNGEGAGNVVVVCIVQDEGDRMDADWVRGCTWVDTEVFCEEVVEVSGR